MSPLNKYSTVKFIELLKHIVTNMLLKQSKSFIVHFNNVFNIYLTLHSLHLKNMVINKIYNYICIVTNMLLKQNINHTFLKSIQHLFKFIELIKHIILLF